MSEHDEGVTGAAAFRMIAEEMEAGRDPVDTLHAMGLDGSGWRPAIDMRTLGDIAGAGLTIRRKPTTLSVPAQEIPAPITEPPEYGDTYWIMRGLPEAVMMRWRGAPDEHKNLGARRIYRTREDCERAERIQAQARGGEL